MVEHAKGITIAFEDSGFTAEILDVTPPGASRGSVDTSHQGTDTYRTFEPQDLVDSGELKFTIHFDAGADPPISGANEEITITFKSGATQVFIGHMTDYAPSGAFDDKITADITVKVSGEVTRAPAQAPPPPPP